MTFICTGPALLCGWLHAAFPTTPLLLYLGSTAGDVCTLCEVGLDMGMMNLADLAYRKRKTASANPEGEEHGMLRLSNEEWGLVAAMLRDERATLAARDMTAFGRLLGTAGAEKMISLVQPLRDEESSTHGASASAWRGGHPPVHPPVHPDRVLPAVNSQTPHPPPPNHTAPHIISRSGSLPTVGLETCWQTLLVQCQHNQRITRMQQRLHLVFAEATRPTAVQRAPRNTCRRQLFAVSRSGGGLRIDLGRRFP